MTRMISFVGALCCVLALAGGARAADVESGSVYCFSPADFSEEPSIRGICITDLPGSGRLMLGDRVLQPGDVLTAAQVERMTFSPARSEFDDAVEVGFLPIFEDRVAEASAVTIGIRGREDKPPIAEDMAMETYKNLPATGRLKVTDPESQPMTFTLVRQPRRGTVTITPEGSFTYTPKRNKVGVDSFTFTAADPAGKTSREATVTVTILKPSDAAQYSDTTGRECRFAAEWMRHTGIFTGEQLAKNPCFAPDREVTRGEFVTMLVKALDIPTEEDVVYTGYADEIPLWLQPYLAAAVRSGLTAGLPDAQVFGAGTPITGAEAGILLQNALDLPIRPDDQTETPAWSELALTALGSGGISLEGESVMTRADAALALYQAAKIKGLGPVFL